MSEFYTNVRPGGAGTSRRKRDEDLTPGEQIRAQQEERRRKAQEEEAERRRKAAERKYEQDIKLNQQQSGSYDD